MLLSRLLLMPASLILVAAVLLGIPARAAEPKVLWTIAEDQPVDLTSPAAVNVSDDVEGDAFLLHGAGTAPIPAQRDSLSGQLRFLASVSESQRGASHELRISAPQELPTVSIKEENGTLQFFDGERPVMRYQREPLSLEGKYERANYIHPLFGLDGETLTQDFPGDHKHHRGIFWAWHQVLVGEQKAGDAWAADQFLSVVRKAEVVDEGPVFATLKLLVLWTSPLFAEDDGTPIPFVEETTLIRLFRATGSTQFIDFEITLKPLVPDVKIGGSENVKGYSGFTVRVPPPQDMVITDSEGRLDGDRVSEAAAWADVSGRFGKGEDVSGIGILTHQTLPEFPPKWLLRHYGMQNVAWPGRHPVTLPDDKPLTLRHRLVIHRGDVDIARVAEHQHVYSGSRP